MNKRKQSFQCTQMVCLYLIVFLRNCIPINVIHDHSSVLVHFLRAFKKASISLQNSVRNRSVETVTVLQNIFILRTIAAKIVLLVMTLDCNTMKMNIRLLTITLIFLFWTERHILWACTALHKSKLSFMIRHGL